MNKYQKHFERWKTGTNTTTIGLYVYEVQEEAKLMFIDESQEIG